MKNINNQHESDVQRLKDYKKKGYLWCFPFGNDNLHDLWICKLEPSTSQFYDSDIHMGDNSEIFNFCSSKFKDKLEYRAYLITDLIDILES